MQRKYTIILTKNGVIETWGTLKEICHIHNLPYWLLTKKKYPFDHDGFRFERVLFKVKVIE